ncbi:hypothetical protein PT078_09205, partial [Erysipelothrix rhusiopathiae]|nr:hypothetical protein [Erysipelothrix rhusiopathiae]
ASQISFPCSNIRSISKAIEPANVFESEVRKHLIVERVVFVSGITLLKLYNEVSIRRHKRLKVLYQSVGYWLFLHFMVLVML